MKKLYFIRHGQSELNARGLYSGQNDTPLTITGRDQARRVADEVRKLRIDLIVCSPLERAHETASIVAAETGYPVGKILTNPILSERKLGEMESTPWIPGKKNYDDFKGAETDAELVRRAQRAMKWLESLPADHILIVAHGGIGRARAVASEEFPISHPHRMKNAQLYELL